MARRPGRPPPGPPSLLEGGRAAARGHINLWIAAGSGRAGIRGAVRVSAAGRPGPRTGPGAP